MTGVPEPSELKPQRREERDADGKLLAEWGVLVGADGAEVRHGEFVSYYGNGQRRERGFYENGVQAGIWTGWAEDGRQMYETRHEYGVQAEALPDVQEPSAADWAQPVIPEAPKAPTDKLILAIEAAVVLCLGWLPMMANAAVSWGALAAISDAMAAGEGGVIRDEWATILTEIVGAAASIGVIVPLLWIMHRSGSTWASFGVIRPRLLRDGAGGLALGFFFIAGSWLYVLVVGEWELTSALYVPERPPGWSILAVALVLNSVAEEFVWRGIMQQRVRQLTGSIFTSVAICSVLFASYHLYHGPQVLLDVALMGAVLGVWTHKARSIWPAVIAHTVYNFWVWISAAMEYAPAA